ncbi:GNAT family N-acetyltransferase [Xenorhabdus budapestensis]|uniref:GNAT family N-acetyltransferase n=1 Tax=Xenorhabdus budapestensis TaxID=290110 RepID=A0ABX7VIG4_XENBU|nr:GNAT family N-acetyltransferase [Xenorhabdus budapestensis]QTL40393.1 GNAT family N-acetyltransferase [Xenorhabdus budapestensis]
MITLLRLNLLTKEDNIMGIKASKFTENEYSEYSTWFNDESVSKFLGDIDNEWLNCTLNSPEISQLVFYDNNVLIGVVGICLPNIEHNYYTMLEFAVNPIFHKHGYGTRILNYLMNCEEYKKTNTWKAIMSFENKNALSFFRKMDGNITALRIVNMSKFYLRNNFLCISIFLLISSVIILMKGSHASSNTNDINTIFIYITGGDMESDFKIATDDIQEILSAKKPDNLNIIIQTGGALKWHLPQIKNNFIQRWKVVNNKLNLIDQLPDQNMDSSNTLSSFITWGLESFPSNSYYIFFWGHGLGAAGGYGGDENYGNKKMSINDMALAFKNSSVKQTKFEIIGFDNCKMANIETAYALQPYGNYLVGSVDYTHKNGWNYKDIIESFNLYFSSEAIAAKILSSYVEQSITQNDASDDIQGSVINLNQINDLVEFVDRIFYKLSSNMKKQNYISKIERARRATEDYENEANMIDLYDFIKNLKTEFTETLSNTDLISLENYINKSILLNIKTPEHLKGKGISIYFPLHDICDYPGYLNNYLNNNNHFSKNYRDSIYKYILMNNEIQCNKIILDAIH